VVSSRFRALLLLAFLFLAALSLRPSSDLRASLDAVCEPARHLRLLGSPLGWLSIAEARAAERQLCAGEEERRAAGRAVLAAAQTGAAPSERTLAQGRGVVHAEVVDRVEGDEDRMIVRFAPESDVEVGMPVVSGDRYVGSIASVDTLRRGEARVDLVTRKEFRVGAEVARREGDPVLLVVGGILPRGGKEDDTLLAAHFPSDPNLDGGEVRVRETGPGAAGSLRALADGFLLGSFVRVRRGEAVLLGVRPALDLRSGPSHVGILCPSQHAPAGPDLARDPFEDERWMDAAFVFAGDASFWRETRVLSAGTASSITDGAAVAFGANLLGQVERAGAATSLVRLLGDPGLEVTALASPAESASPAATMPIGRLVSLGRDRSDGALLLRWAPSLRLEGEAPLEVLLYTASGHRSVPPGLRIGRTALPRGRGPFVLRVRQDATGASLTRARVWREETPIAAAERGGRQP
jgi:cell shape-determining protein MreC